MATETGYVTFAEQDTATAPQKCTTHASPNIIKQMFVDIITPNFNSGEARMACGLVDCPVTPGAEASVAGANELTQARGLLRETSGKWNSGELPADQPSLLVRWLAPLQPGSVRSCSSTLVATSLGTGVLSLPFAFSLCGLVLGALTLTISALVSALSLQILIVSARYTHTASYADLLEKSVQRPAASLVLDLTILLNGIGCVACLLIFEGDFLPAVFAPLVFAPTLTRVSAVVCAAVAVWPLVLPANLAALRYVAVASPVVLLGTIAVVLYEAPGRYDAVIAGGDKVPIWDFEVIRWLQAVSIMVNAFMSHNNAVPAGNMLERPSILRIVKATVNANAISWTLFMAIGIGGYLSWGAATQGDFLLNYPQDSWAIWSCRVMLAVIVYTVIPLALSPTSRSFGQLLGKACGKSGPEWPTPTAHAMIATSLLCLCMGIASAVSNVATLMSILGGLFATALMFWFPALIFWHMLYPMQSYVVRAAVLGVLVFFGTCGFASVCMTASKIILL